MKKSLIVLFVMAFVVGLTFGAAQDWSRYNQAKAVAKAAGNTAERVEAYGWAADAAAELGRPDIQAWQYNNAGHILIQQFQLDTAWIETMKAFADMKPSADKITKLNAFKDEVRANMATLDSAKSWLDKAQALNQSDSAAKVKSNLDFIAWVQDFIK